MSTPQTLFSPTCSLSIDDQLYSFGKNDGHRITFEIRRKLNKFPDPATITVYNIDAKTRENFSLGAPVILSAGWQGSSEIIYSGTLIDVRPVREGPNWAVQIWTRDGDAAFQRTINHSFAKGIQLNLVVKKLADAMGLTLPVSAQPLLAGKQTTGLLVQSGLAQMSLQTLLDPFDLHYSIQDGGLLILSGSDPTAEEAVLLSQDTGLIGSPERVASKKKRDKNKPKGSPKAVTVADRVKVTALIQSAIRPGRKIQLQSEILQGTFRIDETLMKGDTHGNDWYVEATCRAVV